MAIRYRRNINCLGSDALHDLREALAQMFTLPASDEHSFAALAGLHGSPGNYCRHGAPGFLTWHRAYMHAFERALRCIDSSITLPFWDWSSGPTTGVPAACASPTYVNRSGATVPNPLFAGPLPGGGFTARRADIATTTFGDIATAAQGALATSLDFNSFQSALNGPHGSVHVRTGGQMGSVAFAGYDPLFYLHHCNVDRLWARWQASHPVGLPAAEAGFLLDPFRLPYSTTLRPGSDFATTDPLGYRYANFCFVLPPILVWELATIDFSRHRVLDEARSARLVLRSTAMPKLSAELRVFIDDPDANEATPVADNPNLAGTIGLFGMAAHSHAKGTPAPAAAAVAAPHGHGGDGSAAAGEERFELELEIAPALRRLAAKTGMAALKIVAVDSDGRAMSPEHFDLQAIELLVD
ncbi:MAG: tyrosinase family protein [Piscinibacter sp.]|nr:tyrosinase family protein [Piscinibacter sp.]